MIIFFMIGLLQPVSESTDNFHVLALQARNKIRGSGIAQLITGREVFIARLADQKFVVIDQGFDNLILPGKFLVVSLKSRGFHGVRKRNRSGLAERAGPPGQIENDGIQRLAVASE